MCRTVVQICIFLLPVCVLLWEAGLYTLLLQEGGVASHCNMTCHKRYYVTFQICPVICKALNRTVDNILQAVRKPSCCSEWHDAGSLALHQTVLAFGVHRLFSFK